MEVHRPAFCFHELFLRLIRGIGAIGLVLEAIAASGGLEAPLKHLPVQGHSVLPLEPEFGLPARLVASCGIVSTGRNPGLAGRLECRRSRLSGQAQAQQAELNGPVFPLSLFLWITSTSGGPDISS